MNVLVDTSVWIDFFRGRTFPALEDHLKEGRVWTTPVIMAELITGTKNTAEEKQLLSFLSNLACCELPKEHWIQCGQLRKKLKQKGLTLSLPDCHIAQAAIEISGTIMTRDKTFSSIKLTEIKVHLF